MFAYMCAWMYALYVCVYVYTHVYYIYKKYERMGKILRCDCARARARTLHNIKIQVLYTKSDIAQEYTQKMRKILVFTHSTRFLCNLRICAKITKRERAHTICGSYYMQCIHTYVRPAYNREEWIRQMSYIGDGVLYIIEYIRI